MPILLVSTTSGYIQLITVLVIFVAILAVTALTTKWIANYQKTQSSNLNVEVVETTRIAPNKFIQIVRLGEKFVAIAVCKDTVTMLGEIPEEQLKAVTPAKMPNFKELLEKTIKKDGDA